MKISRIFSGNAYKGTRNYLKTQRLYELVRTAVFFGISLSLFAAGWIATGSRKNLLTVVAVLGCLPACKSAVSAVMFCRYRSLSPETADRIEPHAQSLLSLYDMVFTGSEKTFQVEHLAVRGSRICGYSSAKAFDRQAFEKHLQPLLRADSHKSCDVAIFTDVQKYTDRLDQLRELEGDESLSAAVAETLKSVSL